METHNNKNSLIRVKLREIHFTALVAEAVPLPAKWHGKATWEAQRRSAGLFYLWRAGADPAAGI